MSRDYKARRTAPLDARRLRDFGAGAAAGIVLTVLAVMALNARALHESGTPASATQHPAPTAAPGAATDPSLGLTFHKDLVHPEAEQARRERELERSATAAAARR